MLEGLPADVIGRAYCAIAPTGQQASVRCPAQGTRPHVPIGEPWRRTHRGVDRLRGFRGLCTAGRRRGDRAHGARRCGGARLRLGGRRQRPCREAHRTGDQGPHPARSHARERAPSRRRDRATRLRRPPRPPEPVGPPPGPSRGIPVQLVDDPAPGITQEASKRPRGLAVLLGHLPCVSGRRLPATSTTTSARSSTWRASNRTCTWAATSRRPPGRRSALRSTATRGASYSPLGGLPGPRPRRPRLRLQRAPDRATATSDGWAQARSSATSAPRETPPHRTITSSGTPGTAARSTRTTCSPSPATDPPRAPGRINDRSARSAGSP